MRRVIVIVFTLAVPFVARVDAQESGELKILKDADQVWASIASQFTAFVDAKPDRKVDQGAKSAQARGIAEAAKEFYSTYPGSFYVRAARKIEALATLDIVEVDPNRKQSALQVAAEFRANPIYPASDRHEVAIVMERRKLVEKFGGRMPVSNGPEMERIADLLHAEFGDLPENFHFYASVARGADKATARRMAARLLQWPAPDEAKAEASAIIERQNLIGRPLSLTLSTITGETIDLSQPSGKITIVLVWDARSPISLRLVGKIKKTLPADARVIYFSPYSTAQELTALSIQLDILGPLCHDRGTGRGTHAAALGLRRLPYVLVLEGTGKLIGFGPGEAIAAVIAEATGGTATNL